MFTVDFADVGSVLRSSEEQTYIYFMDFLDECEGQIILYKKKTLEFFTCYRRRCGRVHPGGCVCVLFRSQFRASWRVAQKAKN